MAQDTLVVNREATVRTQAANHQLFEVDGLELELAAIRILLQ